MLKNVEWNVSLCSKNEFTSYKESIKEFNYLWDKTLLLNENLINAYKVRLDYAIEKWDMDYLDSNINIIRPNAMQKKALKELRRYRDMGVNKALVIAATGSGEPTLLCYN